MARRNGQEGAGTNIHFFDLLPADPGRDQIFFQKALWSRGSPLSTKYTIAILITELTDPKIFEDR